jgi:hypothetical protein
MHMRIHASQTHRCIQIQEQSTARWDALLAGLTCRVLALLRRAFLAVACQPARGSRERALNPRGRVKPASAPTTESGVPTTDPTAAGPRARDTCSRRRARPSSARSARASRSRKRMANRARIRTCSDGGGAWNVRAKAPRTSRPSCARSKPRARKPRARAREGVAPRVRCVRAPSPARGSRERALSPRERSSQQVHRVKRARAPFRRPRRSRLFGAERAREGERARPSSTRSELRVASCPASRGWIPRAHRVG